MQVDNNLKHHILNKIEEHHVLSDGKCGVTAIDLCAEIGVEYSTAKPILNEMYKNKEFKIKDGINGYLLFKV